MRLCFLGPMVGALACMSVLIGAGASALGEEAYCSKAMASRHRSTKPVRRPARSRE